MALLYHHTLSAGSRAIRLLMAEYGLDLQLVEEHVWQRREEFLDINPAGTVPVLVEQAGAVVGEAVIAEYLDETQGALKREKRLYPDDAMARAEMRRLVHWALDKFETAVDITMKKMPAKKSNTA